MEGPLVLIAVLIVIFLFNYLVDKIVYTVLGKERAEQIIADVAAAEEYDDDEEDGLILIDTEPLYRNTPFWQTECDDEDY